MGTAEIETIDHHRAIQALREIVKGKEDFVYEVSPCQYVVDEQPSCLIGQALARLGVPLSTLARLDSMVYGGVSAIRIGSQTTLPVTSDASRVFHAAQLNQDNHETWGDSLAAAESMYRSFVDAS